MRKRPAPLSCAVIFGLSIFSLSAFGQLMIEGGPYGTRISNRDGKIDGAVSSSNRDYVLSGQSVSSPRPAVTLNNNSPFRPTNPQLNRNIVSNPEITTNTRVNPVGISRFQEIDFKKGQQLAKMERDLVVLKTTREAGMEFRAAQLFYSGGSNLTSYGYTTLNRIATYHAAAQGGGFTIAYHYDPRSDSSDLGYSRAWVITNYLSEKTGLSIGWFTTPEPVRVRERVLANGQVVNTGSLVKIAFQRSNQQ